MAEDREVSALSYLRVSSRPESAIANNDNHLELMEE